MPFAFATLLTTLIITALSSQNNRADALKLTSLGSTFESPHDVKTANGMERGDDMGNVDYSSMPCAPSDNDGGGLATCSSNYGVDHSFPIHYPPAAAYDKNNPLSNSFYRDFLEGCREKYAPEGWRCDETENDRIDMNLRQPASMFNYTTLGFHKVRAPANVMTILKKFWNQKFTSPANMPNETWPPGNTYTNHWSSPTKMLRVDTPLRKDIWDASKTALEEWTGVELSPTSLYGVRVYTDGAVLAPHVDRNPLVISAIINVAQDVDEPWPLEVYGHDGRAYNVTMDVGDIVFYESHSVIHGRPFPLKGRHYANVFVHFEPLGHSLQHEEANTDDEESLEYLYQKAWKKLQSDCSDDEECKARVDLNVAKKVPHYIVPGSEEEWRWLQTHQKARADTSKDNDWVKGLNAQTAASTGDLTAIIAIAAKNPEALKERDSNGWNPLHEAVRGGHLDIVKFLIKGGLDKNERTHTGNGGSPLWWAKKTHGVKHSVVQYLESIEAEEIPPEGHEMITKE